MTPPTRTRVDRICRGLVLSMLSAGIGLVALELAARWYWRKDPQVISQIIDAVRRPTAPYVMFTADHCAQCDFRNKPIPMPKAPGHYRVCILGGSTVFAGDPALPELIQTRLSRALGTTVEVYNFGVVSQNSSQELAHLLYQVGDLSPDLVVMYDGGNDIMDPLVADGRPGYPFNFVLYERNPLLIRDVREYPSFKLWLFGSSLARHLFRDYFTKTMLDLDPAHRDPRVGTEQWRQDIGRIYVSNLRKAYLFSHAIEAGFVAFIQPTVYFKRTRTPAEDQLAGGPLSDDAGAAASHALKTREDVRREVAALRRTLPIDIVDLSDVFERTPEDIFVDYIHVNPHGNELLAAALASELLRRIKH